MKQKHIEQCVHVNLGTTPEELMRTFELEMPVSLYQLRKKYGYKHRYEVFAKKLTDESIESKQSKVSDFGEYISPSGNRWMSYLFAEYYPYANRSMLIETSFIYYETYGSCGAFFPYHTELSTTDDITDGALIFTSHFFQRMSDRTGIPFRSKELVRTLVTTMNQKAFQLFDDDEVAVKFIGGYGFGVLKSKTPVVMEIRTFLSYEQLSNSQKKKCEVLNSFAEYVSYGLWNKYLVLATLSNPELSDEKLDCVLNKMSNAYKKAGIHSNGHVLYNFARLCMATIYHVIGKKFNPRGRIEIGQIGLASEYFHEFVKDVNENKIVNGTEAMNRFIETTIRVASRFGIHGLTTEQVFFAEVEARKELLRT